MENEFTGKRRKVEEISSMYIHFPYCKHLCNFCDFYKTKGTGDTADLNLFHGYMEESMVKLKNLIEEKNSKLEVLKTLYIGGGTPSLWGKDGAKFLRNFFNKHNLLMSNDAEFTLEVDPGSWEIDGIKNWIEIGANRFSIGIQSLDRKIFSHLDRGHSLQDSYKTLEYFSQSGLNFSIDFILGIPFSAQNQYKRNIVKELEQILDFGAKHVSLYILTVNKGYPLKGMLPEDDFVQREYLEASQLLEEKGFRHYEVSNFAIPGKESRHNLAYWTSKSVAALGKSATGIIFINREKAYRIKWRTGTPTFISEELGEKEIQLEKLYLGLRTDLGVNPEDFFEFRNLQIFSSLIKNWEKRGFIKEKSPYLKLSNRGFIILDTLMGEIFKQMDF